MYQPRIWLAMYDKRVCQKLFQLCQSIYSPKTGQLNKNDCWKWKVFLSIVRNWSRKMEDKPGNLRWVGWTF